MLRMMRSELILNTALVMRWFVAAEHCAEFVSRAIWDAVDTLTRVRGYGKVLVERTAPYAKIENLHDNKRDGNVDRCCND